MGSKLSVSGDWEASVEPAIQRIRIAIIILNVILIITGIILISLGLHLNYYVIVSSSNESNLPPIWLLGTLPIALGTIGLVCALVRKKKWVVVWLVTCAALGSISFITFVILDFLDPDKYDINIQIFGHCLEAGSNCKCLWEENPPVVGLIRSPCHVVRHTSAVYLGLVFVFVISLAVVIVASVLGCVLTTCIRFCAPPVDTLREAHTAASRMSVNRTRLQETSLTNKQYMLVSTEDNVPTTKHDDSHVATIHTSPPEVNKESEQNTQTLHIETQTPLPRSIKDPKPSQDLECLNTPSTSGISNNCIIKEISLSSSTSSSDSLNSHIHSSDPFCDSLCSGTLTLTNDLPDTHYMCSPNSRESSRPSLQLSSLDYLSIDSQSTPHNSPTAESQHSVVGTGSCNVSYTEHNDIMHHDNT